MKYLEHICTGIGLGVIIVLAIILNLYTHGVDIAELLSLKYLNLVNT